MEGDELVSTVNGKRYGIGALEVPTIAELRSRVEVSRAERSAVLAKGAQGLGVHSSVGPASVAVVDSVG